MGYIMNRPVIITGIPRTGSTIVANELLKRGFWVGDVTDRLDNVGLSSLPFVDESTVYATLKAQGYSRGNWCFKRYIPGLQWKEWEGAVDPLWLIIRRGKQETIRSCMHTAWMRKVFKNNNKLEWSRWFDKQSVKLDQLMWGVGDAFEIYPSAILENDFTDLDHALSQL